MFFTHLHKRKVFAVMVILLAALPAASAAGITGQWDGVVVANKVEVPFRFEITQHGNQVQGFFFEGDRKVGSTSGSFENGPLKLEYDFLNTVLEATLDGDQLRGPYRNNRPNAEPMQFRARRSVPPPTAQAQTPQAAG